VLDDRSVEVGWIACDIRITASASQMVDSDHCLGAIPKRCDQFLVPGGIERQMILVR
jgi:hypothetical protein